MAISMCMAAPRIVPAYSSFSRWSKGNKLYPCNVGVALTRSGRVSPPISFPQAKASPVAVEIIKSIFGKDEGEVQAEADRLQKACHMLNGIFGDIILVLYVATKPTFSLLYDLVTLNDRLLRWSFLWALYGAFLLLKEFIKIFSKSQPIWGYNIILGFLIYRANMSNISLHRKGHHPGWLIPIFALVFGKFLADFRVLLLICPRRMPDIIWASIETVISFSMAESICAFNDSFYSSKITKGG